ncbi:DEAD/DEAH box helicase [Streptomyces sp. N35]|uniref:DEAD/DEAH box helicase n=1 Tax=Streptomyces sp. N35 TaxID=2795730 RepID=UPI0018F3C4BA|nr:DEAD/DEAH box helicase [Streptomyces sp. N35]
MPDAAAGRAEASAVSPDTATSAAQLGLAPGAQIEVRDEEWLVRNAVQIREGEFLIEATGASDLVRGHDARFLTSLDRPQVLRPEETRLVPDASPEFRRSRLFLEAVMRKTPLPQAERRLALTEGFLLDRMDYQLRPAEKALANPLSPRILIGDVVGLGKTLEIGVLLGELIRRGRGERILVVTPAPVLEQFQHEMWTRFSLPLVRLDSVGIARIERRIPAGRNPFTHFKRAIVSMDTIKNAGSYGRWLKDVRWDAVVIDESHNLIGESSARRALAELLADQSDALILASATPHNGKIRSFAGLVRLLDPMAIKDANDPRPEELEHLYIRRTKTSREVAKALQGSWAPRGGSFSVPCTASDLEEQVFAEFAAHWLRPPGSAPEDAAALVLDGEDRLFPYVMLKSFLSSHRALFATVRARLVRQKHWKPKEKDATEENYKVTDPPGLIDPAMATGRETASLLRLAELTRRIEQQTAAGNTRCAAKLQALVEELGRIGVRPGSTTRAVVFSERRETLNWLGTVLPALLGWRPKDAPSAVKVLHSEIPDTVQMDYVDEFARGGSEVRLLLTGDGASEGVNLHRQCHHLIHWDLPWSLIRVEQRNGRIDRYGQLHQPEFRAMILKSVTEGAMDDTHVAQRVLEREAAVHKVLGTVEAVSAHHDADVEEKRLMEALLTDSPEDAVRSMEAAPKPDATADATEVELPVEQALMGEFGTGSGLDLLDLLDTDTEVEDAVPEYDGPHDAAPPETADELRLFTKTRDFVLTALDELQDLEAFRLNTAVDGNDLSFDTPDDLKARLSVLPTSYRRDQGVDKRIKLTFSRSDAADSLRRAREDADSASLWPDAHYVGELHPVVEWITDKVLVQQRRQTAPVLQVSARDVPDPVFLVQGVWSNTEGRPTVVAWLAVDQLAADEPRVRELTRDLLAELGVGPAMDDHYKVGDLAALEAVVPRVVERARLELEERRKISDELVDAPLDAVEMSVSQWRQEPLPGAWSGGRTARDAAAERLSRQARRLKTAGEPMVRILAVLEPSA